MKGEKLMDALNDLDEDLILEANLIRQRKRNKKTSGNGLPLLPVLFFLSIWPSGYFPWKLPLSESWPCLLSH